MSRDKRVRDNESRLYKHLRKSCLLIFSNGSPALYYADIVKDLSQCIFVQNKCKKIDSDCYVSLKKKLNTVYFVAF